MAKKAKRLTRADKVNLSSLDDTFRPAKSIGVPEQSLETLAAHGHVRPILEGGEMLYRITEGGQAFLASLPNH